MGRQIQSALLGAGDNVYGVYLQLFGKKRWFGEGVGDLENYRKIEERYLNNPEDFDIELHPSKEKQRVNNVFVEEMTFRSPLADELPEAAQTVYCKIITPSEVENLNGVVIHLSMTGDQGFSYRQKKLAEPLAERGYASILLLPPRYGKRKPKEQDEYFFESVAAMGVVGAGCMVEATAMVRWARKNFPDIPIGLTGISWGGSMAAGAALASEGPLALCSCIADTSPRAISEGIFRHQVKFGDSSLRQNIKEALHSIDVRNIVRRKERNDKTLAVVCVSAMNDIIVPPKHSEELFDSLTQVASSIERVIVPGGHGSSISRATEVFLEPIVRSFELLKNTAAN